MLPITIVKCGVVLKDDEKDVNMNMTGWTVEIARNNNNGSFLFIEKNKGTGETFDTWYGNEVDIYEYLNEIGVKISWSA